jgi:hypothetical protein
VTRRGLPALLALVALTSDLAGAHGLALVTLFGAIPASFVLVLDCYGDTLAARCGGGRPVAAAAALALLVLSAALRSPAVVGGVPRLAVSSLAFAWLLAAATGLVSIRRPPARAAARARADRPRDESRLAA